MLQTNTTSMSRQHIRTKIEPFGGWSPDQKRFIVSWQSQPLTFAELMAQLKDRIISDLRYFRKLDKQHFPDLLQQGWSRLWQALHEDNNLLASMPFIKAVNFVANRCGATTYMAHLQRYFSYHDFSAWEDSTNDVFEDSITDIVIGSSLKSAGKPGHALFSRTIDRLIDIATAIRQVADWCGNDIRKLAALYYLTTNVTQADAGRIAGLAVSNPKHRKPRCTGLNYWSRKVLEHLRDVLKNYLPIEPNRDYWKEQIKVGNLDPVIELAQKYAEDSDRLLALYCLTTRVARTTVVKELGVQDGPLWYAIKQLRQELRCMYATRVQKRD